MNVKRRSRVERAFRRAIGRNFCTGHDLTQAEFMRRRDEKPDYSIPAETLQHRRLRLAYEIVVMEHRLRH